MNPIGSISVAGLTIPIRRFQAVVVGSGAAGLNCADALHRLGVTDTAVIRRKRTWFTRNEMSIHLQRVAGNVPGEQRLRFARVEADQARQLVSAVDAAARDNHERAEGVE